MSDEIVVSTLNDLPGHRLTAVNGEVLGLIVRARNAFPNIGASVRTLVGAEARGHTRLLLDPRGQAVDRLRKAALEKGGDDAVAMRFDRNEDRRHHERARGLRKRGHVERII